MRLAQFYAPQLFILGALALAMNASQAMAQNGLLDTDESIATEAPEWEYHESLRPMTPTQMVQQKAQTRASQRMARMAALEWHGYSKARPRSTATPFSGLYGSQWQGYAYGRPGAWHASRPMIVVTR